MVKRLHLLPQERKQIVDEIVTHLKPQLEQYVKEVVGRFAITESDVGERVKETINEHVRGIVINVPQLKPKSFAKCLFHPPHGSAPTPETH